MLVCPLYYLFIYFYLFGHTREKHPFKGFFLKFRLKKDNDRFSFLPFPLKSPDNKKPAVMMARLQLHPDPNTSANGQLAKFEPESPQSPGAESQMSFNVYEARFSGSDDTCLGALPNSASTIGFLPDHLTKDSRMVPGYSRKIRRLSVCLVLFIAVSLVMTGLFVWRTFYYDSEDNAGETTVHIKEVELIFVTCISSEILVLVSWRFKNLY